MQGWSAPDSPAAATTPAVRRCDRSAQPGPDHRHQRRRNPAGPAPAGCRSSAPAAFRAPASPPSCSTSPPPTPPPAATSPPTPTPATGPSPRTSTSPPAKPWPTWSSSRSAATAASRSYNGSAGPVDIIADVAGYYRGGTPTATGTFGALTPSRIADTRNDGRTLPALGTSRVQILGAGGVPSTGVSAVMLNLTATNAAAGGYLTAYPDPSNRPVASNINFATGQTVANLVVVPVGGDGSIQVFNGSAGPVDIIADVAGYYRGGTPTATGTFGALTPSRIADTRNDGRTLPAFGTMALQVTGQGGVPTSGVAGVVMNVTATTASGSGFITAWPSGSNQPVASNLNFTAGQTVPNLVLVPVGKDGKVLLFNGSPATVNLIADVVGYVVG